MSSEDIRYARRSDIGEASASAELLGRLATVDWIGLMVTLTENRPWYVRELGLSRHHRCGCNLSAARTDAENAHPADASTELRIGNRRSETTLPASCSAIRVRRCASEIRSRRPGTELR